MTMEEIWKESSSSSYNNDEAEEIFAEEDEESGRGERRFLLRVLGDALLANGWFVLLGCALLAYLWHAYFRARWEAWKRERNTREEAAAYHKNPDVALGRMQAMEAARRRMQLQHDEAAKQHLSKIKQKEEAKRLEKIEEIENHEKGLGFRRKIKPGEDFSTSSSSASNNNISSSSGKKNQLRKNDFNPLMGSNGGGSTYRPPKRSCCSGGGCG